MRRPAASRASGAAGRASDAADALLDWLGTQPKAAAPAPLQEAAPASGPGAIPAGAARDLPERAAPSTEIRRPDQENGWPLQPRHVDWLHHRLTIEGSAREVAAFREQVCGAGVIPWRLDLDSLEEDWFHRLVSPPPPHHRSLSLEGARILAGQLRDAVVRRHQMAVSRVGRSRACPFDLHALVPVPDAILRLGPDHPDVLAWLWQHWGTTQELRHVRVDAPAGMDTVSAPDVDSLRISFCSADWTPWRALQEVTARWPALRLEVQPSYETA